MQQLDFFDPLKVELNMFEGPLELLMLLIRQKKMDIETIPLALICKPYLDYLDSIQELNLNIAGEFITIASTLILIKSKSLLPEVKEEILEEDKIEDPEEVLRQKLIEYQKFQTLSLHLASQKRLKRDFFTRPYSFNQTKEKELYFVQNMSLYDLLQMYQKLINKKETIHHIDKDEYPIEIRIEELKKVLEKEDYIFNIVLEKVNQHQQIIVTFLSILELAKMKTIFLFQVKEFEPIYCQKKIINEL